MNINRGYTFIIFIIITIAFNGCKYIDQQTTPNNLNKELTISYSNPNISYEGRIDSSSKKSVDMYWSGTSIKINFEGNEIQAFMKDEKRLNYYNIILDTDSIIVFNPDTITKYYTLASGLDKGAHSIEIFRRTEWSKGKTQFFGFRIKGDAKILPKEKSKKRKIEFYGDSITAGYANEDTSGKDNPDSTNTNNYMTYAAITARNFDAEYSCIAKGGIGIMISWFNFIMPDIYDDLVPRDENEKWDFSLYTPDLVVVNLFQNDSWLVTRTNSKLFKDKFGSEPPTQEYIINAYKNFISNIRAKYPDANIICALGSMDVTKEESPWPGYIIEATKQLNDPKIKSHIFPYKNTKGHPKVSGHIEMAESLTKFINENIEW